MYTQFHALHVTTLWIPPPPLWFLVLPSLWATYMPGPVARFSWPWGCGWDPAFVVPTQGVLFPYDISQLLLKAS